MRPQPETISRLKTCDHTIRENIKPSIEERGDTRCSAVRGDEHQARGTGGGQSRIAVRTVETIFEVSLYATGGGRRPEIQPRCRRAATAIRLYEESGRPARLSVGYQIKIRSNKGLDGQGRSAASEVWAANLSQPCPRSGFGVHAFEPRPICTDARMRCRRSCPYVTYDRRRGQEGEGSDAIRVCCSRAGPIPL